MPGLRRLLANANDDEVRGAAAAALGLLGTAAQPAIPDLVLAADRGNEAALSALIELKADEALDIASRKAETSGVAAFALVRRLGDAGLAEVGRRLRGNRDIGEILSALHDRRAEAEKLASDILFAIRNRKSTIERLQLAELMLELGGAQFRGPVRSAVADLRSSKNEEVRDQTVRILAIAGDRVAMRAWLTRLGRRDQIGIIDYDGYRTICQMGRRAAPALARLTALARSPTTDDWDEESLAVEAIGCIGTPAAVPVLVEALGSPSYRIARAAARALERIAPPAAIPALADLASRHWHPAIRDAAARALAAARGHRPPPLPPNRFEPPGETFACYSDLWPTVATSTVPVAREERSNAPLGLKDIKGLSSYLALPEGWLATADSGEFGGGLYLLPTGGGDPREISPGNFRYIAQRTDGLVAVEGIGHMVINRGALWRVERDKGQFVAEPWVELPSRPLGVRESPGGLVVVDTELGSVAVDQSGRFTTGPCRPLSDEAREVLQVLLDDARLQSILATQRAPTPLHFGLWGIEEDPGNVTFRGQPVLFQRDYPPAIDAGTFFEVTALEFTPSSSKAEVRFVYPDMAFVGRATFTRTNQQWRLAQLKFAPLEHLPG